MASIASAYLQPAHWMPSKRSVVQFLLPCLGSSIWPDACGPIRKEKIMKIVTSLSFQG